MRFGFFLLASTALQALFCNALYEDQVGIVDWSLENVGRIQSVVFQDTRRMYVGTASNVVSAMNTRTGAIEWRNVLSPHDSVSHVLPVGSSLLSLSGSGKNLRMWETTRGAMLWDNVVYPSSSTVASDAATDMVVMENKEQVLVLSANTVSSFNLEDGSLVWSWRPEQDETFSEIVSLQALVVDSESGTAFAVGLASSTGDASTGSTVTGLLVAEFGVDSNGDSDGKPVSKVVSSPSPLSAATPVLLSTSGPMAVSLSADGESLLLVSLSTAELQLQPVSSLVKEAGGAAAAAASIEGLGQGAIVVRVATAEGGGEEAVVVRAGTQALSLSGVTSFTGHRFAFSSPHAAAGRAASTQQQQEQQQQEQYFVVVASPLGVEAEAEQDALMAMFDLATGKEVEVAGADESIGGSKQGGEVADVAGHSFHPVPGMRAAEHGPVEDAFAFTFTRRDGSVGYRCVTVTSAHSTALLQAGAGAGRTHWVREEALALVEQVEFVELPAVTEKAEREHVPSYGERLSVELESMLSLPSRLQAAAAAAAANALGGGSEKVKGGLDPTLSAHFGFHKLALARSSAGKLFGISMETGAIVWARLLLPPTPAAAASMPAAGRHTLLVTRGSPMLDHHPELLVFSEGLSSSSSSSSDSLSGVVSQSFTWLDATNGSLLRSRHQQGTWVKQVLVLDLESADHDQPVLTVDADNQSRLLEASASVREAFESSVLPSLFLYQVEPTQGLITGFKLAPAPPSSTSTSGSDALYAAQQLWSLALGGSEAEGQEMVAVAARPRKEVVASQARLLGDDSILLKYSNPNVIAVAMLGPDASAPAPEAGAAAAEVLTVYLVDTVSGRTLHRARHASASRPVTLSVSENWAVYSYFNPRAHRTEMGSLALYEGMIDKHGLSPFSVPEPQPAFTSFAAPLPVVLQKTFIMPRAVATLAPTLTAQGITQKHFLVGLVGGQLLSLDRRFLDPRRPDTAASPQDRAEGMSQYRPHLPVVPTSMASFNQTIPGLRAVYAEPTLLESTCLVLATGLDLWYTRVTPSKTFDLLAPDFNHALLLLLVAAMTVLTVMVSRMVTQKRLKASWK